MNFKAGLQRRETFETDQNTKQSQPVGQTLYLQEPQSCIGSHNKMSFEYPSKPAWLGAVSARKWSEFEASVHQNAQHIIHLGFAIFLPAVIGSVVLLFLGFALGCAVKRFLLLGLGLIITICICLSINHRNAQYDNNIRELCTKFSGETGFPVEYETRARKWLPKEEKRCRAVIIWNSRETEACHVQNSGEAREIRTLSGQTAPAAPAAPVAPLAQAAPMCAPTGSPTAVTTQDNSDLEANNTST